MKSVSVQDTICQEGSDGNVNIGLYACILKNELRLISTLNGQVLGIFKDLMVKELSFGDFTNFVYIGGFGEAYFD